MTHGLSYHPLYDTWRGMIRRCTNPSSSQYSDWGGRGIEVCARWLGDDGLANFIADMGPRPSDRHSLERLDNDGNYEPLNCVWIPLAQQRVNQRKRIHNATFDGLKAENKELRSEIDNLRAENEKLRIRLGEI